MKEIKGNDPQFLIEFKNWVFNQDYKSEFKQTSIIILRDFFEHPHPGARGDVAKIKGM